MIRVVLMICLSSVTFLLVGLGDLAPGFEDATGHEWPMTVAENSGYQSTSRSDEVLEFIDSVVGRAPHVRRVQFGETVEGRKMVAAIVANPPVTSAAELNSDSRCVVLLLGNIHPGECAGKEALLELIRMLAKDVDHAWLKKMVLVVVPNYNADGNDRMGKGHRPGQVGPVNGMGWRENAQGLDLNRDFVKLDSPEGRSLVRLIDAWNPNLFMDLHTTNGSRHRYVLTYGIPNGPGTSVTIRNFLRGKMMPEVTKKLLDRNIATFYYGNFNAEKTKWLTYGCSPRYSTEYVGLRGRLAILSEAYSYASYPDRIKASREFVRECLNFAERNSDEIRRLTAEVCQRAISAGQRPNVGDRVPLSAEVAAFPEKVTVLGYKKGREKPTGGATPEDYQDYQLEYWGDYRPAGEVQRPFAYLIPATESRVVDRLRMHGIRIEQLQQPAELEVEAYKIASVKQSTRSYQNHSQQTVTVDPETVSREFPKGTFFVRTGQPLSNLIVHMLEPTSDDGLARWNFFDTHLVVGREYPVRRILAAVDLGTEFVETINASQQLTLDQIFGPTGLLPLAPSPSVAKWIPGTETYSQRFGGRTIYVDATTGSRQRALSSNGMAEALTKLPAISEKDARKMASQSNQRDARGTGYLIKSSKDLFYWKEGERQANKLTQNDDKEQFATFSPDGKLVAFVRNYNLYVVDVHGTEERALTTDGTADLLHGQLDWVYQEELYGRGKFRAFWWSPDSRWLAFLRLDESPVLDYTLTDTIPRHPRLEVSRYPLAGDPNPRVDLGIVSATGGPIRWVNDDEYDQVDHLISRVDWSADSSYVTYQLQNREQTWLDLRQADPESGRSSKLFRDETGAWVQVLGPPLWLKDSSFLWLSERNGNKHIYHVSGDGKKFEPVTSGPWDVDSLYGLDPKEEWVYFLATKDRAIETRAYRIKLDGSQLECLTPGPGSHKIVLNDTKTFFVDTCSTVTELPSTRMYRSDGKYVRTIDPNLNDYLKYFGLGRTEFCEVNARDGVLLDGLLIKPTGFDPSRKYPVLCHVYAGPQSASVWNRWLGKNYLWHQLLAQKGYAVWLLNNRSASTKGAKYAWTAYQKLGQQELSDIEDGISWLKQRSWVNGDRIGIWGWSYGGFMTCHALTHSKSFRVGMSVAAVTDWRNYDSIYTERYMNLPQNNADGYKESSLIDAAQNLHGRLLLVHGTIDDNVHVANSLQFANALQNAGKQFDLMLYPGNRHGIRKSRQSRHLRETLTQFLLKNL